jgi:hypothetical protein
MINTTKHNDKIKSIIYKYGIVKSLDFIVNDKETIRQVYNNNLLEFLNQFNDLKTVEKSNVIYYVDKDKLPLFMYYQDKKNGNVYISYNRIWMFFSDVIGLKSEEIKGIMKNWLEETYNLRGLTPQRFMRLHIL